MQGTRIELRLSQKTKGAIEMINGGMENAPDLLLELKDRLLELFKSSEVITLDNDSFSASTTDKGLCFLKFGDDLLGLISTLGARYGECGFVVPASLERK